MYVKVANYAIKYLLQDFKPNLLLLNEIYTIATVISPVTIAHKQNSFKQLK